MIASILILVLFLAGVVLLSELRRNEINHDAAMKAKDQELGGVKMNLLQTSIALNEIKQELDKEINKNKLVVSQKKSSETKLGLIAENALPLLKEFPYDSQNLRHLGSPIDFLYFNFEDAEITFIEVKSGNSKESKRQKIIKNAIIKGKVYYEEVRIDQHGLKIKRTTNQE